MTLCGITFRRYAEWMSAPPQEFSMALSASVVRETAKVWAFGLTRIPLIAWLTPVVEEVSAQRCIVRIPLTWRSRNHLKAMYFGALCAGADCAAGLIVMNQISRSSKRIDFVFKDLKADFLKRGEDDVVFTCVQGEQLMELVRRAESTLDRVESTVKVVATVPTRLGDEPIGVFHLTLSLRQRG